MTMKTMFLKWLCLAALLYPFLLSGQDAPKSVDIKAEKQVLRRGETIKITLYNFRGENNKPYKPNTDAIFSDRIIVSCNGGTILDGTDWNINDPTNTTPTLSGDSKIFLLGSDTGIEFYYRASESKPEVEIRAYCSNTIGTVADHPLEKSEAGYLLNNLRLKILLETFLLLQYTEEKQEHIGSTTVYKHEINAEVRIDFKPSPIPNSLQVTDLKVLKIQGRAERLSSDEHLVATATTAQPAAYNRLVILNTNPANGSLVGIVYTAVPLRIDWRGDDIPEGPPDVIHAGPVSKDERGPMGARWDGSILAEEFGDFPDRGKMSTEEKQRIREKQASLLMNFTGTQVHPDFEVQGGNDKTFYFGKGKWEDENKSGENYYWKTFNWELYLEE
jgi:hypothetical protein